MNPIRFLNRLGFFYGLLAVFSSVNSASLKLMIESSIFTLGLQILVCIALGALYAWLLYRQETILTLKEKRVLAVLRCVTVASIASLLILPLVKSLSYSLEKPIVVIAHDNSTSIANWAAPNFNYSSYSTELKKLSESLASKYEVRNYSFGDSVKLGLDFSGNDLVTDANKLALQLNTELQNRNVGAIIFATDGLFNKGGNPQYELNRLNAPIYSIAMGSIEEPRDISVSNLNYNDLAFLGNNFTVEVLVQGFKVKGEQVKVSVYDEKTLLKEEILSSNSDDLSKEISFTIPATKVGLREYTVQLTRLGGELTYKNNSQSFFVEIVEHKQSVLIAASVPHPDLSALKNIIQKFKQYEVDVFLVDDLAGINLNKYGAVILHQLPSNKNRAQQFLSKLKSANIPIWHIVGVDSDFTTFNTIQDVVDLSNTTQRNQFIFPIVQNEFSLFQLDERTKANFSKAGPFQNRISTVNLKQPIFRLFDQKIESRSTDKPLWFFSDFGGNRSAYLLGEGLWNMYLQSDNESAEENSDVGLSLLVSNTIQYLSLKGDRERFKISPSKRTYNSFESIVLNAQLLNVNFESINSPEVRLKIRDDQNRNFQYSFTKTKNAYKLELGKFSSGIYNFRGEVEHGGKKFISTGKFYVSESLLEYQQHAANHNLLNNISSSTGGKVIGPSEIQNLISILESSDSLKTISYEDKRFKEIINYKILFFLILFALTVEWWYRKRMGAI